MNTVYQHIFAITFLSLHSSVSTSHKKNTTQVLVCHRSHGWANGANDRTDVVPLRKERKKLRIASKWHYIIANLFRKLEIIIRMNLSCCCWNCDKNVQWNRCCCRARAAKRDGKSFCAISWEISYACKFGKYANNEFSIKNVGTQLKWHFVNISLLMQK